MLIINNQYPAYRQENSWKNSTRPVIRIHANKPRYAQTGSSPRVVPAGSKYQALPGSAGENDNLLAG
jgi:hypothetical protein